ncbi:MAG: class I SAM-dependent methyltransferase [Novipirellula sp. JB048]
MLERIAIPGSVDQVALPAEIRLWISEARHRIEAFQDRWDQPQIEQFVAADYELVYQTLAWTLESQFMIGKRFLEWGCGFAVVSALAAALDLNVIGIEAEAALLDQGRHLASEWDANVELIHGNFLPPGSEDLADDPTLPSLGHPVPCAYATMGLELDDFAIVYSYPWPGEDDFHERVFHRYACRGALLLQFCGPNDVRLWRKSG